MKPQFLLFAALGAAPFLPAQDAKVAAPAAAMQAPNPKTKEHEALTALAGHWQTSMKMAAMPGVPGMEKAFESTGTERAELICNGLWLKATSDGSCADGKPFQGLWLMGYDPFKKSYVGIMTCSQDEPASVCAGSYDEKTKTWTFTGSSPMGEFRSVYVFADADNSTETCYLKAADGKETQCMQIVRKRTKGAAPVEATAKFEKPASKEHALLAESLGAWDALVKTSMPPQPPTEEKATERVVPICSGKWFWSDFKGEMMGMPFEGHGLTGYDATQKKYVGFWIDSFSPNFMQTSGTYDEKTRAFVFEGSGVDEQGKPIQVLENCTHNGDQRSLHMTFKNAQMTHTMEILYKRAKG